MCSLHYTGCGLDEASDFVKIWVLSHVSAMTSAHVGYITLIVWGQRYPPGEL